MNTEADDRWAMNDRARTAWYEANDRTWICADCKERVVEYAPTSPSDYEGPCGHTAFCARCVREHVALPGDDIYDFENAVKLGMGWYAVGNGALSYKAHVAFGSVTP